MPDLPRRRRPQRPSWTEPIAQRLTPAIKVLVVTNVVLYLFFVAVRAARAPIVAHLALGPGFLQGEVWQPFTALFVHIDFVSFILNLIGLWFVGLSLESVQGTRRFLIMFFTAGVVANVSIAAVSLLSPMGPFAGSSLAVLALFVALGRIYGKQETQFWGGFAVQARWLALIFVAFGVVSSLWPPPSWPLLTGTLVATAIGFLGAAPRGLRELYDMVRARTLRRRYRVLEGGASRRTRSPKYWN